MRISGYGVTLTRLTEDKIEKVRNWRNDPKISQYMEYQDYITPEMQSNWFQKIDNDNNYYFIIEYQEKEAGLINIRDIDYSKGEGEGGIFIYDDSLLNSTISFQSVLCLFDFAFEKLKLKKIIAHIMSDNKRAIQYNLMLGFIKQPGQESVLNQLYILDWETYKIIKQKILRLLDY